MNNLNAMPSSDSNIKNMNDIATNLNNSKNNDFFEKLLTSDESKDLFDSNNFQSSNKELSSLEAASALTDDYLGRLAKQPVLNQLRLQDKQGNESVELYDQKMYAIGKLSYIEKDINFKASSGVINKDEKLISNAVKKIVNMEPNKLLPASKLDAPKLIGCSFVSESGRSIQDGTKAYSLAVPLIKNIKYDREKITEIVQGNKIKVYIRNYFTPIEDLNNIVSQYVIKFKNQVSFIFNGKGGN